MQQVKKTAATTVQRSPGVRPTLPAVTTPAPQPPGVDQAVQRHKQLARDLTNFTARQPEVQRQVAQPALHAAALQRQEIQRLAEEQTQTRTQADAIQRAYTSEQLSSAVQRQQAQALPATPPRQPQSNADWVTIMRHQAQQVDGKFISAAASNQFSGLQRQVTQTLVQRYRADHQAPAARQAEYAGHLVSLQRHPLSSPVAQVFMSRIPQGERPTLQRAVDEALQREQADARAASAAQNLDTLQRHMAELDAQATQPVMQRIQERRGSGNPLPEAVQRHLEQGLNHDLSGVRIHDDAEADKMAKGVNAIAFTTGKDIFFQSGKFNPNTQSGLELLAHEVTHTVQQSKGKVGKGIDPDSGLESEARDMGKKLAHFMPSPKSLIPPVPHKDGPHAPGQYTQKAALQRAQDGAASYFALKPLYDLQPQSVQRAAHGDLSIQRDNIFSQAWNATGGKVVDAAIDKGKELIASGLTVIPGYRELCMAFGKDLVTGNTVSGSAESILTTLTNWVPGPLKDIMRALRETNVIGKAWEWFKGELGKLNLGGALGEIADAIKSADLGKAKNAVTSRISGVKNLITGSAGKIAEIAMTVITAGLGPLGQKIMAGLRGSQTSILQILKDPVKFARNLIEAVKGGFKQFTTNAPKHLQNGVGQWLTGSTGITFPAKFDLQGVFMTALTVVGLTYQNMPARLVKAMGPGGAAKVQKAESTVDALKTMKGGLDKAQEMKSEQGSTGTAIQEGIKSEVTKSLVMAGIQKVVTMLIPGGGFINAIIGAFQTVQTIVQQAANIGAVITNALSSVSAIAAGNISSAIGFIDRSLGGAIPIALAWLSKVVGLGNFGGKVKTIIQKVKGKLDSVVDKIVAKVKGLIDKIMSKGKPSNRPGDTQNTKGKEEARKAVELTLPFAGHTLYVRQAAAPTLDMASKRDNLSNKVGRHASKVKAFQKQYTPNSDEYKELDLQFNGLVGIGQNEKSLRILLKKPVDANSQVSLSIQRASRSLTSSIANFLRKYQLPDIGDDLDAWLTKYREDKKKLHGEFEPQNLKISTDGDSILISYFTKTGKRFETTVNRSGLPGKSQGFNLAITSLGRGTTQDPANKIKNKGHNSAHLSPNLLGGSGYKKSMNLMTTSDHFNKVVMGAAEDRIINWIKSNKIAVLDFTIEVDWGIVKEEAVIRKIIDEIRNMHQLTGADLSKAQAGISQRLIKFKPILKAVEDVIYRGTGTGESGVRKLLREIRTGPDKWLKTT